MPTVTRPHAADEPMVLAMEFRRAWLCFAWRASTCHVVTYMAGPAPGSIEGAIYTTLPLPFHVFGAPEVYGQSLVFSACLVGWYRRPHPAWSWVLGALTVLTLIVSAGGAAVLHWA